MKKIPKAYIITVVISAIFLYISVALKKTSYAKMFIFSQILDVLPSMLLNVFTAHIALIVLQFFSKNAKQLRRYYIVLYIILFLQIIAIGTGVFGKFDIYKVVASCIACFFDMILYEKFQHIEKRSNNV